MRKKWKRSLSFFLSVAMCLTMAPDLAWAAGSGGRVDNRAAQVSDPATAAADAYAVNWISDQLGQNPDENAGTENDAPGTADFVVDGENDETETAVDPAAESVAQEPETLNAPADAADVEAVDPDAVQDTAQDEADAPDVASAAEETAGTAAEPASAFAAEWVSEQLAQLAESDNAADQNAPDTGDAVTAENPAIGADQDAAAAARRWHSPG